MSDFLPTAKSAHSPDERRNVLRVVAERGLCGLASDTKWDEFICGMRSFTGWKPRHRFKCVDGPPSGWDAEWSHHLPFPFVSLEWFDVAFLQETREHRLPPRTQVADHSAWIEELLRRVGLEHQRGRMMTRIFGYSPKSLELFDEKV